MAQHVDRILVAQLGRGQVLREMEGDHAQQAQPAQGQRQDGGDHAASGLELAAAAEQLSGIAQHVVHRGDRQLAGGANLFHL